MPSCRIHKPQRVVHAVGVPVETLGTCGILHVAVSREERRHHGIVHAAVHVDQTKRRQVFMSSITSVEHGFVEAVASRVVRPGVGIALVAPGIVAQPLLHGAVPISDRIPAAKVVLEDIMGRLHAVLFLYHGEHAVRAVEVGQLFRSAGSRLRDVLATAYILLSAEAAANVLFHADPLVVVAVGIADAVVALLHFAHLVEARVGDVLRRCREHTCFGGGVIHGVGLGRGVIHRIGEHCLASGGLRGHAAIAVVGRHTGLRRAETHTRQAVLAIVTESLRQVFHVVLSSG